MFKPNSNCACMPDVENICCMSEQNFAGKFTVKYNRQCTQFIYF